MLALVVVPAQAQKLLSADAPSISVVAPVSAPLPVLPAVTAQPRISPELALDAFYRRAARQLDELGAYTDATTIEASLPESSQKGKYELRRSYEAPKNLAFTALRFVGDNFVKTNIITRLMQQEAESVQKGGGAATAISPENYRFTYRGTEELFGLPVYVFQLKPKEKRTGLFKGKIYLDVFSGRIRRAEGEMVKSPSFFVKKIRFVQDYIDYAEFCLPVHIHSEAETRLVGPAVVDIYHGAYQAHSLAELRGSAMAAGGSAH